MYINAAHGYPEKHEYIFLSSVFQSNCRFSLEYSLDLYDSVSFLLLNLDFLLCFSYLINDILGIWLSSWNKHISW